MVIIWQPHDGFPCGGFIGEVTIWHSKDEKDPVTHKVAVGQGAPLGSISVDFDSVGFGAWEFSSFSAAGITERDLQWATLWAALAVKARRGPLSLGDLRPIET
jgi:hypothetical protein